MKKEKDINLKEAAFETNEHGQSIAPNSLIESLAKEVMEEFNEALEELSK